MSTGADSLLEGAIRLRIRWDGRRVSGAQVESTRPLVAAALEGKRPDEVLPLVPRLFAVCAGAQRACAEAALATARTGAEAVDVGGAWARELDVAAECALEALWRLTLDLPQSLDETPEPMALSAARRSFAAARLSGTAAAWREVAATLRTLLERSVLGQPLEDWLALGERDGLDEWLAQGRTATARRMARLWHDDWGASGVPLMPSEIQVPALTALSPALRSDRAFPRYPTWNGMPRETGALARQQAHPLIRPLLAARGGTVAVRWLARLVELAQLVLELEQLSDDGRPRGKVRSLQLASGVGMAWVENARGLLIHLVETDAGRVGRYVIVAPTEWNFHPDGPFVGALAGVEMADAAALDRRARLLAQALDPCVAYRIEVGHA
ncbi:MAG TPA: nickel-dependent hydrogenase large subunit [Pelomicrobium sp.]|nr:nickel-dependent hydrogenase large subunit [Pelomicrobium sp.]